MKVWIFIEKDNWIYIYLCCYAYSSYSFKYPCWLSLSLSLSQAAHLRLCNSIKYLSSPKFLVVKNKKLFSNFCFGYWNFFIIAGIRVQSLKKGQITMDIDFRWGGDPSIILAVEAALVASIPIQVSAWYTLFNVYFVVFLILFMFLCCPCVGSG